MKSVLFGALAAAFVAFCPSVVQAQPVADLSAAAEEALAEGRRIRVIVQLNQALDSESALAGAEAADASTRALAEMQDRVLRDALGRDLAGLRASASEITRANAGAGDAPQLIHAYRYTPAIALTANADELAALAAHPDVARIVKDGVSRLDMDESLTQISADVLHAGGFTGRDVVVAVLDSGVDHSHAMFDGRIVASACFATTNPDVGAISRCPSGENVEIGPWAAHTGVDTFMPNLHGTHVAGTVMGAPITAYIDGQDRNLRGVAPGATLMAVNVFSFTGDPANPGSFDSDQVAALEWVFDNRVITFQGGDTDPVAAINMSLGGGLFRDYCAYHPSVPIITLLREAGVATVIASGNNGWIDALGGPACIEQAITVGAVDRADEITFFSNSHFAVDVMAPGLGIRSADLQQADGDGPSVIALNGTSMATPHVAGAVAVLRSAFPNASVNVIETALEQSGVPVTDTRFDPQENPALQVTRPRINLAGAFDVLSVLTTAEGPIDIQPLAPYRTSVNVDRPELPERGTYLVTNTGSSTVLLSLRVGGAAPTVIRVAGETNFREEIEAPFDPGDSFELEIAMRPKVVRRGHAEGYVAIQALPNTSSPVSGPRTPIQSTAIRTTVFGYDGPDREETPFNDDFADAAPLNGVGATIIAGSSTFGATHEAGEPDHAGLDGNGSVWFSYTTDETRTVQARASGRIGRTAIAVYTGASVDALTEVGSEQVVNDDDAWVNFTAQAGATYFVAVDYRPPSSAAGGEEGEPFSFAVRPAAGPEDRFNSARQLTRRRGSTWLSTIAATGQRSDPQSSISAGETVWARMDASQGTQAEFVIGDVTGPQVVTFYAGTSPQDLEELESFSVFPSFDDVVFIHDFDERPLYVMVDVFDFGRQEPEPGPVRLRWRLDGEVDNARVAASTAPFVRPLAPGESMSGFLGMMNAADSPELARRCDAFAQGFPGAVTLDPAGPVSIRPGDTRRFTYSATLAASGSEVSDDLLGDFILSFDAGCENAEEAEPSQLNAVIVEVVEPGEADILLATATTSGDGVLSGPADGLSSFTVSARNIGGTRPFIYAAPYATASSDPREVPNAFFFALDGLNGLEPFWPLDVSLSICQTDPTTGACTSRNGLSVLLTDFDGALTPTFKVDVTGFGSGVDLDPATNRVGVVFFASPRAVDDEDFQFTDLRLVGASSVALTLSE